MTIFTLIAILALLLVFIFWQISTLISIIFGVPFVKTPEEQIKRALNLASLKPNEVFYDLGSGDGRVLVLASQDFKAKSFGFEISPWVFLLSLLKLKLTRSKAKIYYKNFLNVDFKKADVIYLYLISKVIKNLKNKFLNLNPGTRLISYKFPINYLNLYKREGDIYVYKI